MARPLAILAVALILGGGALPSTPDPAAAVARYFMLLGARDYAAAYRLWSDGGRAAGKSFAAWRAGFRNTMETRATVGLPHGQEGGAGSLYVQVPVTVDSRLRSGIVQHFAGEITLRRVNDVPGSTPEQRQWHIARAQLKRVR